MGDDAQPILVVGSVALDAVRTPTESVSEVLGGAASYFCLSASMFAPVRLVAVVTRDAVEELGLKLGMPATAIVKSTSVMVLH